MIVCGDSFATLELDGRGTPRGHVTHISPVLPAVAAPRWQIDLPHVQLQREIARRTPTPISEGVLVALKTTF